MVTLYWIEICAAEAKGVHRRITATCGIANFVEK